jgi:hypothetical protein
VSSQTQTPNQTPKAEIGGPTIAGAITTIVLTHLWPTAPQEVATLMTTLLSVAISLSITMIIRRAGAKK